MGNCSTKNQQIGRPEQQPILQTQFVKPQATVFQLPPSVLQPRQITSKQGVMSKTMNFGFNNNNQTTTEQKTLSSKKPNTLFVDPVFKAQRKSIGQKLIIDHLQWKRPHQFLKEAPILWQPELQTFDLKQGRLQNSYLVSGFASLALPLQRFPPLLQLIFSSQLEPNNEGVYTLRLFIDGQWKKIIIDDLLPTSYNRYCFSSYRDQLWIYFIQKALAKYFKSYQNIQKFFTGHFLTALTGAPYEYVNIKSSQLISSDTAWQFVKSSFDNNYLLIVSTENTDRNKCFQYPSCFSYTVLDCQQVFILTTSKKKKQRILKLENPWGRYQWKGRWSQYSDVWSQQLRHELDYEKADETVMWINIQDLLKNFGQICACKLHNQYLNTSLYIKFKQEPENQLKGIYLNVESRTQGFLSLIQKHHNNFFKNHLYSMSKIMLLSMDKETLKLKQIIAQKVDADYYCTVPIELNPGLYYLIIQMDWNSSFSKEAIINIYADNCVNMVEDPNMPSVDSLFYELAMIDQKNNPFLEVYQYPFDKNIKRIKGTFGGYVYYHYINNSQDNKYLSETVKLGDCKNLVVTGEKYPDQFGVKLMPGQQKFVKMKITKEGNGDYQFNPKIKNQGFEKFTAESLLEMLKKKPTKVRQRDIQGKKIEVFIKTFQYSGGVALLYINQMSQHSYIEQIVFQIENLVVENETLDEGNNYNLQLQPHSEKMISFLIVDPSRPYKFKTQVQYYLGTPQFKF